MSFVGVATKKHSWKNAQTAQTHVTSVLFFRLAVLFFASGHVHEFLSVLFFYAFRG